MVFVMVPAWPPSENVCWCLIPNISYMMLAFKSYTWLPGGQKRPCPPSKSDAHLGSFILVGHSPRHHQASTALAPRGRCFIETHIHAVPRRITNTHFHLISLEYVLQLPLSVTVALANPLWHCLAGWSGKSPVLPGPPVSHLANKSWTKFSFFLSRSNIYSISLLLKNKALGTRPDGFGGGGDVTHCTVSHQRLKTHEQPAGVTGPAFPLPAAHWPAGPPRSLLPEREAHHLLYLHHRGKHTPGKR